MEKDEKKMNESSGKIEFKNQQEEIDALKKEVEELRKSLEEMTNEKDKYQRWWNDAYVEREAKEDVIKDLQVKLDKIGAVAELYLKSKAWKK